MSRQHSSEEFGKTSGSGSPFAGLDAPMIGAPASILVDGIAEQESGKTPTPPPFSVRTAVIVLVVILVVGLIGAALVIRFMPPPDFSATMMAR
jgi:hypothetical protein